MLCDMCWTPLPAVSTCVIRLCESCSTDCRRLDDFRTRNDIELMQLMEEELGPSSLGLLDHFPSLASQSSGASFPGFSRPPSEFSDYDSNDSMTWLDERDAPHWAESETP